MSRVLYERKDEREERLEGQRMERVEKVERERLARVRREGVRGRLRGDVRWGSVVFCCEFEAYDLKNIIFDGFCNS